MQRIIGRIPLLMLAGFIVALAHQSLAQTVYVTKTGKKYHRESCQYLRQSKIEMKLEQAKVLYDPCSVCKPPTQTKPQPGSSATPASVTPPKSTQPAPSQQTTKTRQCSATTKAGTRCKRTTTDASGKCWQHQ